MTRLAFCFLAFCASSARAYGQNENNNDNKNRRSLFAGFFKGDDDPIHPSHPSHSDGPGPGPYDAIIVGAGLSGLMTARTLYDRGYTNLLILEARNRVGGRTYSITNDPIAGAKNVPIEMGAEWAYEIGFGETTTFFDDNGLGYSPAQDQNYIIFDAADTVTPLIESAVHDNALDDLWNGTTGIAESMAVDPADADPDYGFASALTFYRNSRGDLTDPSSFNVRFLEQKLKRVIILDFASPNLESCSVRYLGSSFASIYKALAYTAIPNSGWGRAAQLLAQQLPSSVIIATGAKVTNVDRADDDSSVSVTYELNGENRTAVAPTAAVTVPLGVLKAGTISFTPPLSAEKQDSIDNMGFGNLEKIAMVWPDPENVPWKDVESDWLDVMRDDPPSTTGVTMTAFFNANIHNKEAAVLVGWMGGNDSIDVLNTMTDEQVLELALSTLRQMYGDAVTAPSSYYVSRWVQDPYARGSYSVPLTGRRFSTDAFFLSRPEGPVYFAGESTNTVGWEATTKGAWDTGELTGGRMATYLSGARSAGSSAAAYTPPPEDIIPRDQLRYGNGGN